MGEIYEHPLPPDKIGDFANLRCEPGFCCGGAVDPNVLLTVPLPLPPNLTCCSKKLHRVAPRLFFTQSQSSESVSACVAKTNTRRCLP